MLNYFRKFWEEARYVFKGEVPGPVDHVEELGKIQEQPEYNKTKVLGKEKFDKAGDDIKKALDRAVGTTVKGTVKDRFKQRIAKQALQKLTELFKGYKNYIEKHIGTADTHLDEYKEAKKNFEKSISDYVARIETRLTADIQKAGGIEKEIDYFSHKEQLWKAKDKLKATNDTKTEIVKSALFKMMGVDKPEDQMSPSEKNTLTYIKGMAPYIAKNIKNIRFASVKDLQDHIQKQLGTDTGVMRKAMADMIEDSPKVIASIPEQNYVKGVMKKMNLNSNFGKKAGEAANQIARRYHIIFDGKKQPIAYVDMISGNKKPKEVKPGEMAKEIKQCVKYITTKTQFAEGGKGRVSAFEEELSKVDKTIQDRNDLLKKGEYFNRRTGEEIDRLADLKGDHPELQSIISDTASLRRYMEDVVGPSQDDPKARELLANTKDPKVTAIAKAAQESGYEHPIVALLKLLQRLSNLGRKDKMDEAKKDVEGKVDAAKAFKTKAQEYNKRLLANMQPQPTLKELLGYYKKPDSAKDLFGTGAMQLAVQEKRDAATAPEDAELYEEEREFALNAHFVKGLKDQLGLPKDIQVIKKSGKITLMIPGDELKMYHIDNATGDKLSLTSTEPNAKPKIATIKELKTFFKSKVKLAIKESDEKGKDQIKTKYEEALNIMVVKKILKGKKTELGKLVSYVKFRNKPAPEWKDFKKLGKNNNERQELLDKARVKFIMDNYDAYKGELKQHKQLASIEGQKQEKGNV